MAVVVLVFQSLCPVMSSLCPPVFNPKLLFSSNIFVFEITTCHLIYTFVSTKHEMYFTFQFFKQIGDSNDIPVCPVSTSRVGELHLKCVADTHYTSNGV